MIDCHMTTNETALIDRQQLIDDVVNDLKGALDFFAASYLEETEVDVRIQLDPDSGRCYFRFGDPQYDQDHRGYWGYGTLSLDEEQDLIELATHMVDEALEDRLC